MNARRIGWGIPIAPLDIFPSAFALCLLIGLVFCGALAQTLLVDRIAAVVNGRVITESDIRWYLALDPEAPEEADSEPVRARALHQLIDHALLMQEAEKLPALEISEAEIENYLAQLRARFPSEDIFRRRMHAVGLQEKTLREIARARVRILRFIEFRFRAFVFVSDQEIQWYYEHRLVPEATQRRLEPPPLDQVRALIEQILRDEKVKAEMIAWLDEARRKAEIILYPPYRPAR